MVLEPDLNNGDLSVAETEKHRFSEDIDSACSTPYVSAPSSPGRGTASGYFFSAPASPMHFVLSSSRFSDSVFIQNQPETSSFEFEFSSRFSPNGTVAVGSMSSADELFLNGQIRPMKLSSHLQRPQILSPLLDPDVEEDGIEKEGDDEFEKREDLVSRGRDLKLRSRSLHRKARSLSPLRNAPFQCFEEDCDTAQEINEGILELKDFAESKESELASTETTPSGSASSSRSSSSGRNSKKWIFLKDLLYRSKSEGRGNGKEKFWTSISFSPSKEKRVSSPTGETQKQSKQGSAKKLVPGKPSNGIAKRRVPPSPHELHYTANRAQAEEMKKRTFLPYRQGLLGCLGFSSKGYGALTGLARTLKPVPSR